MASDLGIIGSSRNKNDLLYYDPPKDWEKTTYYYGYTPWRTKDPDSGREGFWTLKYRLLKSGTWKLVKKIRFGRRKIARARAIKWYQKHYGESPR